MKTFLFCFYIICAYLLALLRQHSSSPTPHQLNTAPIRWIGGRWFRAAGQVDFGMLLAMAGQSIYPSMYRSAGVLLAGYRTSFAKQKIQTNILYFGLAR